MPHVELKIVETQNGLPLPAGQEGSVLVKGFIFMAGYHNKPEETKSVLRADGWLDTGDLGYLDAEGYLYITGHSKELINRGGENIYPKEIEVFY